MAIHTPMVVNCAKNLLQNHGTRWVGSVGGKNKSKIASVHAAFHPNLKRRIDVLRGPLKKPRGATWIFPFPSPKNHVVSGPLLTENDRKVPKSAGVSPSFRTCPEPPACGFLRYPLEVGGGKDDHHFWGSPYFGTLPRAAPNQRIDPTAQLERTIWKLLSSNMRVSQIRDALQKWFFFLPPPPPHTFWTPKKYPQFPSSSGCFSHRTCPEPTCVGEGRLERLGQQKAVVFVLRMQATLLRMKPLQVRKDA